MPCLPESEQIYIFNRMGFLPLLVQESAPLRGGISPGLPVKPGIGEALLDAPCGRPGRENCGCTG